MQLIPDGLTDALLAKVTARLDARLNGPADRPVAVGLSGGGDSHALLAMTCRWAQAKGRRVLALTLDHCLNPQSAAWTAAAGEMARAQGADWQPLVWADAAAGAALQERARMARHALLAEAARKAGAGMLLLGHTADDAAENHWMRQQGTPVGRLRELAVSPVWPQGRGITLLRPLLGITRADLRSWLKAQGVGWIDDPANADPRFGRIRARQALEGEGVVPLDTQSCVALPDAGPWADAGVFRFSRQALARSPRALSVALVCAAGASVPPRGPRRDALFQRLTDGGDGTAVLGGARVERAGDNVLIFREAGEQKRSGLGPLALTPEQSAVWDGRFLFTAHCAGWQVLPASGNLSRLNGLARRGLAALPPAARASLPVLHNVLSGLTVLAHPEVSVDGLCGRRYRATSACLADETTQESDLFDLWHGETGPTALFSF